MIHVVNKHTHRGPAEYIGRGSPLGNPFKVKPHGPYERGETIAMYEVWLDRAIEARDPRICGELNRLWLLAREGDLNLMCFCAPKACHGDVVKRKLEARL